MIKRNKKIALLTLNNALLFLCVSMYLGTGWSIVLFSFPIIPQVTVSNYYLEFVPEVAAATNFFTYMTTVMLISGSIMLIAEWKNRLLRWIPLITLASILASTGLTVIVIFPLNNKMSAGITGPVELRNVLRDWVFLTATRVVLWSIQWVSMMCYFGYLAYRARTQR